MVAASDAADATADNPDSPLLADPSVPRPAGTPCVVTLLDDFALHDTTNGHAFTYAPPGGCSGAWAKVVLVADYSYDPGGSSPNLAGVALWLNGVNLHLGGTPLADVSAAWHVERDVTDYAPLFHHSGTGHVAMPADFFPYLSTTWLRVTARLLVYPATTSAPAPRKADAVYALGDAASMTDPLQTRLILSENNPTYPASKLASTLTLPRNVERAYLDVLVFSSVDWVWWSCVPGHYTNDMPDLFPGPYTTMEGHIGSCAGGAFREAEVRIDGQPAGVAPIYPWITAYSLQPNGNPPMGGLVAPIPQVRALNLLPYRVDLSPFAGLLSDGNPHEIAVTGAASAANINLSAAASLLVYRDAHSTRVTGAITRNTLVGQSSVPSLADTLQEDATHHITGSLITTLRRQFVIDGYIDTARGRISNRVAQTVYFADTQDFDIEKNTTQNRYQQDMHLASKVWRNSYSSLGSTLLLHDNEYFSYPLHVLYQRDLPPGNVYTLSTAATIEQSYDHTGQHDRRGITRYGTQLHNHFAGTAQTFEQGNTFTSSADDAQTYLFKDNRGSCYERSVAANASGRSAESGASCPNGLNFVRWFARPDGSPESIGWAGWQ